MRITKYNIFRQCIIVNNKTKVLIVFQYVVIVYHNTKFYSSFSNRECNLIWSRFIINIFCMNATINMLNIVMLVYLPVAVCSVLSISTIILVDDASLRTSTITNSSPSPIVYVDWSNPTFNETAKSVAAVKKTNKAMVIHNKFVAVKNHRQN